MSFIKLTNVKYKVAYRGIINSKVVATRLPDTEVLIDRAQVWGMSEESPYNDEKITVLRVPGGTYYVKEPLEQVRSLVEGK